MEVKYITDEKNEAEVELDNQTIAEVLRAYLVKDEDVSFAAWKKEHPSKKEIFLKIKTKGKTARKAIADAIKEIEKEADNLVDGFKKAK